MLKICTALHSSLCSIKSIPMPLKRLQLQIFQHLHRFLICVLTAGKYNPPRKVLDIKFISSNYKFRISYII